mmetsp:Transcript_7189/g.8649  ORF Transcript_7189/g.8649 Transcript_7189/m.8649 type:complete len:201 (+) Transcript_7189:205-807(+)
MIVSGYVKQLHGLIIAGWVILLPSIVLWIWLILQIIFFYYIGNFMYPFSRWKQDLLDTLDSCATEEILEWLHGHKDILENLEKCHDDANECTGPFAIPSHVSPGITEITTYYPRLLGQSVPYVRYVASSEYSVCSLVYGYLQQRKQSPVVETDVEATNLETKQRGVFTWCSSMHSSLIQDFVALEHRLLMRKKNRTVTYI